MQTQLHPTVSCTDSLPSQAELPWQLQAVQEALSFESTQYSLLSMYEVSKLLAGMWHPEAALRYTAADVAGTSCLQKAAATPLPVCPIPL